MRLRTWWVAACGLAGLLVLIAVSIVTLSSKAEEIYGEIDQLNSRHHDVDAKLRRLRSDVNLSGIFVRDYLLDVASAHAPEYRRSLTELREANMKTLDELRAVTPNDTHVDSLQAKLADYWQTFDPLFDWTPAEKILQSARFLRREVVPRRDAAIAIAQEIEELNNANLAAQRAGAGRRYDTFRADVRGLLWRALLLGLVVALIAVFRLRVLERRTDEQRADAEDAEGQLRRLSQQLVAAQEAERRNLSRELHDHVGQVLTALRMELARIDRLADAADARRRAVAECRQLVDELFHTVRDLALGLRPSMLDDFGLQSALEWHVRDFIRRYGVDVSLEITGDVEGLPDDHRTCIYRVVQEAMTNCVRHADAHRITIAVRGSRAELTISVADDGIGIEPATRRRGFGLRGIEERVKELGGTAVLTGAMTRGTTLAIRLPVPDRRTEAPLARAVS